MKSWGGFSHYERIALRFLIALLLIGSGVRWYKHRQLSKVLTVHGTEQPALPVTDSLFYQQPTPENPLNLNSADRHHLELLPGIGPVRAERIIAYRDKNGLFKEIDDLTEVYGIGPKTIRQIRKLVTVE